MATIRAAAQESVSGFRFWLNELFDARWNTSPLTSTPKVDESTFLALWNATKAKTHPDIDAIEQRAGYAIDKGWIDDLALHTQIVVKNSDLLYVHGRLLYSYLRKYLADTGVTEPTIVETGTARGFSALCMAKALEDAGSAGHIVTLDVLPHNRQIYWNCIDDHQGKKTREQLLSPWSHLLNRITFIQGDTLGTLPRLGLKRVHFAFLDAQHIQPNVLGEFKYIEARQLPGDVCFFDDVTPSDFPGVVAAVEKIASISPYDVERITASEQRGYALAVHR